MAKKHPENKYDLVLYDLDGTLQDSVPLIVESFHKAYERVFGRCDRTDADLMTYIGAESDRMKAELAAMTAAEQEMEVAA